MAQFPVLRLTRAGQDMVGASQGGGKLIFVRAELGDGQLGEGESVETLRALKRRVMQLPLQGFLNGGNGKARLRFVVDNSALAVGFFNREIGIVAKMEGGDEQLYAYTNAGNYADYIPSKDTPIDSEIIDLHIVIGNASHVVLQTQNGAYATKIDLEEHRTAAELDHPEKSVRKKHLHQDVYESPALTGTPTAPTAGKGTNNGQIASTAFVAQAIAALVNSAPGALDTLQKLAAALGNDANFAASVTNALAGKVSKSGNDTIDGRLTALSFFTRNWFRAIGNNSGLLFEDYGGGWTMSDPEWLRSHNGKGVYTSGQMKADSGFVGTASNANNLGNKSLQWIIDQINAAKTGIIASNLAQNGWVKFANGLIVQWGVGTEVFGEQQFDIALPIAFQNACFSVSVTVIQSRGVGSDYGEDFQVIEYNSDKIKLYLQHFELNAKPAKPLYIAIGV